MSFEQQTHNRSSLRLKGYDYARAGAYFATLCVHERQCLFGEIVDDRMLLNQYGRIVRDEWLRSSQIRPGIQLDEFVVMPNHFHGILIIVDDSSGVGAYSCAPLHVPHRSARKQSKQQHKDVAVEEYVRGYRRMPESIEEIRDAEILGASVVSESLWEGSD